MKKEQGVRGILLSAERYDQLLQCEARAEKLRGDRERAINAYEDEHSQHMRAVERVGELERQLAACDAQAAQHEPAEAGPLVEAVAEMVRAAYVRRKQGGSFTHAAAREIAAHIERRLPTVEELYRAYDGASATWTDSDGIAAASSLIRTSLGLGAAAPEPDAAPEPEPDREPTVTLAEKPLYVGDWPKGAPSKPEPKHVIAYGIAKSQAQQDAAPEDDVPIQRVCDRCGEKRYEADGALCKSACGGRFR